MIDTFYLKKNDLQPFYRAQVKDSDGAAVDITGATIYCTMKSDAGVIKINRQTTGIYITAAASGQFEYRWQSGDTNTTGRYSIEFEVNPAGGGKFTVPVKEQAIILIKESLDAS